VIEAMAWGKPVLGSHVGGIPELVRDGLDGLLVPYDDPAALGEAMTRLAADDDLVATMGRSARARVEERFDAPAHYAAVVEAYGLAQELRRAA
jgi:glycosyltransferase involved in cell wall biosynthesis